MLKTILLTTLFGFTAHAEMSSRNSADIGFTDNANLATTNKESDMYYRLATNNQIPSGEHTFSFRLAYMDYLREHQNDYTSLTLQDSWGDPKRTYFTAAIYGQWYPNGSSGTTESSFDSFGLNFLAGRDWKVANKYPGEFGAGYKLRYYPSFDGRNDHYGFGFASATHEVNRRLNVLGYGEGGTVYSSLPDYTKLFFELTGTVEYLLPHRWLWSSDLILGQSYFLDRSITTQTRVANKSGRARLRTETGNERYTNITLATEAMRTEKVNFKWGGGASVTNQSSRSGDQDYSAFTIEAKLLLTF